MHSYFICDELPRLPVIKADQGFGEQFSDSKISNLSSKQLTEDLKLNLNAAYKATVKGKAKSERPRTA